MIVPFLALTKTPSIAPSWDELTVPCSATGPVAVVVCAGALVEHRSAHARAEIGRRYELTNSSYSRARDDLAMPRPTLFDLAGTLLRQSDCNNAGGRALTAFGSLLKGANQPYNCW